MDRSGILRGACKDYDEDDQPCPCESYHPDHAEDRCLSCGHLAYTHDLASSADSAPTKQTQSPTNRRSPSASFPPPPRPSSQHLDERKQSVSSERGPMLVSSSSPTTAAGPSSPSSASPEDGARSQNPHDENCKSDDDRSHSVGIHEENIAMRAPLIKTSIETLKITNIAAAADSFDAPQLPPITSEVDADDDNPKWCFVRFLATLNRLVLTNTSQVMGLGGVEAVTGMCKGATDPQILEGALRVLEHLSKDPIRQTKLIESDSIEVVVALVNRFRDNIINDRDRSRSSLPDSPRHRTSSGSPYNSSALIDLGVSFLRNCSTSNSESAKARIVAAGGVEVLLNVCNIVSSMAEEGPKRVTSASVALAAVKGDSAAPKRDGDHEIVSRIYQNSVEAMRNLTWNVEELGSEASIGVLVSLCKTSNHPSVLEGAARTLCDLTRDNCITQSKVGEAGGVEALVGLCYRASSEPAIERAACALKHLTNNPVTRAKIESVGGVGVLMRLCDKNSTYSPSVVQQAGEALQNLVNDDSVLKEAMGVGASLGRKDSGSGGRGANAGNAGGSGGSGFFDGLISRIMS